jgi:hypothetical protein
MPGMMAAFLHAVASPARHVVAFAGFLLLSAGVYAQTSDQSSIIEQSRLYQQTPSSRPATVTANGTALPAGDDQNADDSFGVQQVLKNEERQPHWFVSANESLFYTSNAALTRRDTISDGLSVTDATAGWMTTLQPGLQLQVALRTSIFRYFDNSALDFENLGATVGASWAPRNTAGVAFFARYDFTELLDKHSRELLSDHEWTIGAEKAFVFGRAHALTTGVTAMFGISDPFREQRDQVGAFANYHVQLSRTVDVDLFYRLSGYFYNKGDRKDLNQALSAAAAYHLNRWASIAAFISFADNRSKHSVFDYDVFTTGGGVGLSIRY